MASNFFTLLLATCAIGYVSADAQVKTVDVAIVGGGLSGLSAAKDLVAAGKTVQVLEARHRVGGRVLNDHPKAGGAQEVGAEFVGPTQDRVNALAKELGLQTYRTYNKGKNLLYQNGKGTPYGAQGALPPIGNKGLNQLVKVVLDLNSKAGKINPAMPWNSPNATEYDSQTLSTYFDQMVTDPSTRFILNVVTTSIFSAEAAELSYLYTLAYIASSGNKTSKGDIIRLTSTPGGAQENRIKGGTQLLAIKLAEKLGKDRVALGVPVRSIEKEGSTYTVTADGMTVKASYVVVAMSPPLAARIIYKPLLPATRDQLTQKLPMGSIGKAIAIYKTPFWRKHGLTGQVVGDVGVIQATFDNSPPDNSYGAMMGFVEADAMREYDDQPEEALKAAVVKAYVKYFGPEAANPSEVIIQRWDRTEFSRGGPVAYGPPGVLTRYGPALRAPAGGIHFAGTESATYWVGYMSGAIESGERAAQEILDKMK